MPRRRRGPSDDPGFRALGTGQRHSTEGSGRPLGSIVGQKQPGKALGGVAGSSAGMSEARERQENVIYNIVLAGMTEKRFQALVRSGLEHRGFVVVVIPDMRRTMAGWPDLFCLHDDIPVLLALEIKTITGRVTVAQKSVLKNLARIPGVRAQVVRPTDWPKLRDEIDEMLSRKEHLTDE